MKKIIYLLAFLFPVLALAQTEKTVAVALEVGNYIKVNTCKKGAAEFQSMDVYARTNPYNKANVDSLTGEGLLDEFFNDKSIDAKRLPCVMGGKKYKIGALQEFEKDGETKRVALLYTAYPLTLIWVELDKALELGEITLQ
jgi:hypothetical protein